MKLKFAVLALALTSVFGVASAADPISLKNPMFDTVMGNVSSEYNVFGLSGSFSNNFTFSIASILGSDVEGSGSYTVRTKVGSTKDISGFTVGLYQKLGSSTYLMGSDTSLGNNQGASFSILGLPIGDYFYQVKGLAFGDNTASYNFSYASSPALAIPTLPVPEPETYAMMLAGLGLLGFAARRKAKANQA